MPRIFVSYRPSVTKTAARLSRELIDRYGPRIDVDLDRPDVGLPGYRDFVRNALRDSAAMLALLGPDWFEPLKGWNNEYANPTLFELRTALDLGIPVIPVFVGQPTLPPSTPPFLSSLLAKPSFVIDALDQFGAVPRQNDLLRASPSHYRRLDLHELIREIGGLVGGLEKQAPGPRSRRSEIEEGSSSSRGSRPDRRRLGPMVEVAPEVRPDVRRAPGPMVEVAPDARPDIRRAVDVSRPSSPADFSVIAPGQIKSGLSFVVEVWVAPRGQRDAMLAQALKPGRMLERASRVGVNLERGMPITVILRLPDLEINGAAESMGWNGDIGNVSFIVRAPDAIAPGTYPGAAKILQNGIPIVDISFELTVVAPGAVVASSPAPLDSQAQRIRRAFASYAHEDRLDVLFRVQGIEATGTEVFLDVISLRRRSDWETALFEEIDSRDRLFLFWSQRAAKSSWVDREWRHALKERGVDFIEMIPLEDPRLSGFPEELKQRHLDSTVLAFIELEKAVRASTGKPG
jgi:hypothetical protein